jgi:hypothetical protein
MGCREEAAFQALKHVWLRTEMKSTWSGSCGREWGLARDLENEGACVPCKVFRISNLKTMGNYG